MPSFIIAEKLTSDWVDAEKFNSKGRIVDIKGNAVDGREVEEQFRLIGKKEQKYTFWERLGRALFGVICVMTGQAFIDPARVKKLFTKDKRSIRLAERINPSKNEGSQLAKGMPSDAYFQKHIDAYEKGTIQPDKVYTCQDGHTVFTLPGVPGYIFKKQPNAEQRYKSMRAAEEVCLKYRLDLLKIPHAKRIGEYIIEEKLELPSARVEEEYFKKYASSINETIRQLALFICKTGFADVAWRNIPVLEKSTNSLDLRKIALIDLEDMDPSDEYKGIGIYGMPSEEGVSIPKERGLIGCVTEAQAGIVQKVAAKELPGFSDLFKEAAERRKQELAEGQRLELFYQKRHIKTGKEPLPLDHLQAEEIEMARLINDLISESSDKDTVKRKRHFILNTQEKTKIKAVQSLVNKGLLFKMELYQGKPIIQA